MVPVVCPPILLCKAPPATFERFHGPFVFKFSKLQDKTLFNIYRMSTFTPPNRLAKELNTALFWQEVKKADIFDKLGSPEGLESLILRRAEYLFHDAPKEGRKSRSGAKLSTKSATTSKADYDENDQDASNKWMKKKSGNHLGVSSSGGKGSKNGSKRGKAPPSSPTPPPTPEDDGSGVY
ncbi:hypothetical protein TrRE_jg11877, partial [Triparma retinervis]